MCFWVVCLTVSPTVHPLVNKFFVTCHLFVYWWDFCETCCKCSSYQWKELSRFPRSEVKVEVRQDSVYGTFANTLVPFVSGRISMIFGTDIHYANGKNN